MTAGVSFRVDGTPAPQGSKRHVGGGRMVEMSKKVGPWREAIRAQAQITREREPGAPAATCQWRDGHTPLIVMITFLLPRPRGHYGTGRNSSQLRPAAPPFPAGRPDVDKLARAVLDGLTMGGIFGDDAQVVMLTVRKRYALNEPTGAVITVRGVA